MDFQDDYCHIDENIYYICENIPSALRPEDADSVLKINEYNSQQTIHCKCKHYCQDSSCECILNSNNSNNYFENQDSIILASPTTLTTDKLIFECNSLCSCNSHCQNRLVRFGPRRNLKIEDYSDSDSVLEFNNSKGLGLTTLKEIPKGGFICEYAGEILTKSEAVERNLYNESKSLMNYIICLNEHSNFDRTQTFIDPSKFGNIGRYLNHSCDPNCVMLPIRIDCPIPKLCLFALCNIEAGSELTFHYGSVKIKDNNLNSVNRKKCLCLSSNCTKWLPCFEYG